eukprot:scaffold80333_cov57-Phaeocystis_antarctica.AAC.1
MQADVVPFGHDAPADAPPAADDSALHPRAARLAAGYTAGFRVRVFRRRVGGLPARVWSRAQAAHRDLLLS